jgi:hypothetical protein
MAISETDKIRIISAYERLKNITEVSEALNFDRKTVQRWVGRFKRQEGIRERKKSGRPLLMTKEATATAFGLLRSRECETAADVAIALEARGLTPRVLSEGTVSRGLSCPGPSHMVYYRGPPKKELTPRDKLRRLLFAKANLRRNWGNVLSTDRKKFNLRYPGVSVPSGIWLALGEKFSAKTVSKASGINLYMGISRFGVTAVHLVTGSNKLHTNYKNKKGEKSRAITAHEYEAVLKETLLPGGEQLFRQHGVRHWLLLQDNDTAHGDARAVVAAYNRQKACTINILPAWPPNSPDLNPIENVWGWASRKANIVG